MISVVLYGRNDNYGYNLHKRAALSLNCIAEVLDKSDEILFVDYNTPDDFPTFPEAIQDTLTERARELLRIFRVRPLIHERFKSKTRLLALEPIARNVAVRRSHSSNRWILSTNTDMIFILQRGTNLTDVVRNLPRGFYHAPRIELPETLWESLDRRKPTEIIQKIRDWGWSLHLNEIVYGSEAILYDGPGDFQLFERDDLIKYHGFNEEMLLGWHVDSNIAKRMTLLYGKIGDLGQDVYGYHCDHTRQITPAHSHLRTENDWRRFIDAVDTPGIPEQAKTWGCAEDDIEETNLRDNQARTYIQALQEAIGPPLRKPRFAHYTGSTYDSVDYDPSHVMPFLADVFASLPRSWNVGWFAAQTHTLSLFARIWQRLGFTGRILLDDPNIIKKLDSSVLNIQLRSSAALLSEADVFVFDFGTSFRELGKNRGFFANVDDLRTSFARVARHERERQAAGGFARRVISLNAINNRFENFICQWIAVTYSPFSGRLRQGFVLPRVEGAEDWLPLVQVGEAGSKEGRVIRNNKRKVGVIFSSQSRNLERGWYNLSFNVDAPIEDRQRWRDSPCILISVRCGATIVRNYGLSGSDLNKAAHELIFEISSEISDTFLGVSVHFLALSPVAVEIQTLTITNMERSEELKKFAVRYSTFPVSLGTVLDFQSGGNGMVYTTKGWAIPEHNGTWTSGALAGLIARVESWPADDMIMQVIAQPLLVRNQRPSRAVEVIANGRAVAQWTYSYGEDNGMVVRSARIPRPILAASPILNIDLRINDPIVPTDMGIHPTDDRQLGLCVSTVSFLTEQVRLKQDDAVVAPGTIVDFSATGRATGYQVSGWARPEKTGTWTQDAKASLTALVVGWPLDDMLLQIIAQPFMVREGHPSLSVQVIANGTAVEQWTYSDEEGGGPAVRSALIPKSLFAASPILNIELRIEKPAVPSAMGIHPDGRSRIGTFCLNGLISNFAGPRTQ